MLAPLTDRVARLLGMSAHDPAPVTSLPSCSPSVTPGRRPNPGIHEPPTPRPIIHRRATPEQRVRDAVAHIDALLVTVPRPSPDDDQGALSTHAALLDVRLILVGES